MKKEILLLASKDNTGKTTTITLLYDKFLKHYKLEERKVDLNRNDFRAFHDVKGNKVGFATDGDVPSQVQDNCERFKKEKCNICITACRSRGAGKKYIKEWAKKNAYNISCDFISCKDNNNDANEEKARMMLSRLQHLISN